MVENDPSRKAHYEVYGSLRNDNKIRKLSKFSCHGISQEKQHFGTFSVKMVLLASGPFAWVFVTFVDFRGWWSKSLVLVGRMHYQSFRRFSSKPPVFLAGVKNTVIPNDRFDNPEYASRQGREIHVPVPGLPENFDGGKKSLVRMILLLFPGNHMDQGSEKL